MIFTIMNLRSVNLRGRFRWWESYHVDHHSVYVSKVTFENEWNSSYFSSPDYTNYVSIGEESIRDSDIKGILEIEFDKDYLIQENLTQWKTYPSYR